MPYKTINVSPEYQKIIKQYAAEKETTVKAVIECLILELLERPDTPAYLEKQLVS